MTGYSRGLHHGIGSPAHGMEVHGATILRAAAPAGGGSFAARNKVAPLEKGSLKDRLFKNFHLTKF